MSYSNTSADVIQDADVLRVLSEHNSGYIKFQTVDTIFSKPNVLVDYVDVLWDRLLSARGELLNVSREEMLEYILTLVWIRIKHVRDERRDLNDYDRFLTIPAFVSTYLRLIGRATSDELGVEVLPKMDSEFVPLSPEKMKEISSRLRFMRQIGLEFTDVLPQDRRGDWSFMTLQYVGSEVASHSADVHPGVGLAGSFVQMQQVAQVFNPLVTYGAASAYRRVVSRLVETHDTK